MQNVVKKDEFYNLHKLKGIFYFVIKHPIQTKKILIEWLSDC
jgi:hypothetical protein